MINDVLYSFNFILSISNEHNHHTAYLFVFTRTLLSTRFFEYDSSKFNLKEIHCFTNFFENREIGNHQKTNLLTFTQTFC